MIDKHDFDIDHSDEGGSDNNDSKETKVVPCPWQVNTQMMVVVVVVIIMMMLATMQYIAALYFSHLCSLDGEI